MYDNIRSQHSWKYSTVRRHMMNIGLKRLKVWMTWSVLVLLLVFGYVTVTVVVNPSQLTQGEDQHIQRKWLLVMADQNSAAVSRLETQLPTPEFLSRVRMYHDIQRFLETARYNRTVWKELDLRPIYKPVEEFKNPCWWEWKVPENTCPYAERSLKRSLRWMERGRGKTLRCLPYFYIIGQAKCGTTTLFSRISQHPDVAPHAMKETHWICHHRLEVSCSSTETYLNLLQTSSAFIQSRQTQGQVRQYVIGDATANHFSTHGFWDMLPGNKGCTEPCVTDTDVIHHMNPHAKLILILRNPTTRLYSQYFYKSKLYKRKVSKQDFHDLVVTEIVKFQNCLTSQSLRGCCYNYSLSHYLTSYVDIRGSIYQVFLDDWMAKFPKDQIHVVKFEDFVENEKSYLTEIFKFLKLSNLSDEELERITNMKALNQRVYGADVGDMMNSTRVLLDTFYKPYNDKLVNLMKNEKWNW